MKAGAATLKTTAIVTALIALGSMTTMRVEADIDGLRHDVAVSFDSLQLNQEDTGETMVVLETSREELEGAPEFDIDMALAPAGSPDATAEAPSTEADDRMAADTSEPDAQAEPDGQPRGP